MLTVCANNCFRCVCAKTAHMLAQGSWGLCRQVNSRTVLHTNISHHAAAQRQQHVNTAASKTARQLDSSAFERFQPCVLPFLPQNLQAHTKQQQGLCGRPLATSHRVCAASHAPSQCSARQHSICRYSHAQDADSSNTSSSTTQPTTTTTGVLQTDPVQLCELLARLAQLQVKPHQPWLADVLTTMKPHLQDLSTAQLSSTLQVLGGWGFMPAEPFMQALQAAVRQQLGSMTMRHIADCAWGLAQLQCPRQPMLNELLQAALTLMQDNHCSARTIAAQQQQDGCQLQQQSHACCPASLADLVWSVAKLQHNPGITWLSTFASTSRPLLSTFTPHQLAQLIWAFARLPYKPDKEWMHSFLDAVRDSLRAFDGKSVSLTAWGLATLKVQPNMRWLFAFERQAERTLSTLAASELACTLWALSELKDKRADKLRLGRLVRRQEGKKKKRQRPGGQLGIAGGRTPFSTRHCSCATPSGPQHVCLSGVSSHSCLSYSRLHVHSALPLLLLLLLCVCVCTCAVFWGFDYEALANPRLLRVVRQLTLGPQATRG